MISLSQLTFIPDRQMMGGVFIINKLLDFAKINKKYCLLVKVDFATTYDRVSCDYLKDIMKIMGFGIRWLKWTNAFFSSYMSILINGSPTIDFKIDQSRYVRIMFDSLKGSNYISYFNFD